MDKLLATGMVNLEEQQGWLRAEHTSDRRLQMADSVKTYLTNTLQERPDNKTVNYLLYKNYRD